MNLPSRCRVSLLLQTSVRRLPSWRILWPTSDQWADTRLHDWADSWDKTPFIPRDLWLPAFLKKYMLQRHSSQTLVLRTEFGAHAAVTQSTPQCVRTRCSETCVCRSEYEELQHRSAYVLMFMCLLGGNDAVCSLYHLYHSAQLYSFSFIHFPSYLKGDDTQVNMSWQVKYKLSMNLKK